MTDKTWHSSCFLPISSLTRLLGICFWCAVCCCVSVTSVLIYLSISDCPSFSVSLWVPLSSCCVMLLSGWVWQAAVELHQPPWHWTPSSFVEQRALGREKCPLKYMDAVPLSRPGRKEPLRKKDLWNPYNCFFIFFLTLMPFTPLIAQRWESNSEHSLVDAWRAGGFVGI